MGNRLEKGRHLEKSFAGDWMNHLSVTVYHKLQHSSYIPHQTQQSRENILIDFNGNFIDENNFSPLTKKLQTLNVKSLSEEQLGPPSHTYIQQAEEPAGESLHHQGKTFTLT